MWDALTECELGLTHLFVKIDQVYKTYSEQQKTVYIRNTQYADQFPSTEKRHTACNISVISDGKLTTRQFEYKPKVMEFCEFMTSGLSVLPYTCCERSDMTTRLHLGRDHQGYIVAPQFTEEEGTLKGIVPCTPLSSPAKPKDLVPVEDVEVFLPPSLLCNNSCTTDDHSEVQRNCELASSPIPSEHIQDSSFESRKALLTSSPLFSTGDIFADAEIIHCSSPLTALRDNSLSPSKLRNQSECSCESHDSGYENSDVDDGKSLVLSTQPSDDVPDGVNDVIIEESEDFDIPVEGKLLNGTKNYDISNAHSTLSEEQRFHAEQNTVSESNRATHNPTDLCKSCEHFTDHSAFPTEDQKVLVGKAIMDMTCHTNDSGSISRSKLWSIEQCRDRQLEEIDRRRVELQAQVDQWSDHLTKHIHSAYEEEKNRVQRESERVFAVAGVKTPTKKMCAFVNTRNRLSMKDFGTFSSQLVVDMHSEHAAVQGYQMTSAKHIRTFESRDQAVDTDYMATGLSYSESSGDFIITDMGADTCKIFSEEGRLQCDLELDPLEEPSQAIAVVGGGTVLACSKGLKYYDSTGKFSHMLAEGDIKCPQSVAFDSTGCYIVSDMHDCGSMIVTLEQSSLLPLRIFSGSHYDTAPQSFTKAWYIHVRKDGSVILSDRGDHTVKAFDVHGKYLWSTGGIGACAGQFFTPAGIAEDRLGNILVADSGNDRVQMLSSAGEWLGVVVSGDEHSVNTPMDVAVDSSDRLAVLQASGTMSLYTYLHTVS